MQRKNHLAILFISLVLAVTGVMVLASCARMGNPDGGWYDETPPRVVGATPADKGTNVKNGKVSIFFNEFVKLENATEKMVVSPPQIEQPEVKQHGKRISVELKDSLIPNTTYTIDFSDAISDNNEGNPMGAYTYSFSTGDHIDTLEVSGKVLSANNLEPIKGILVGLTIPDSVGGTMTRVSRTDSRGQFIIRGIAPGEYCCYALNDMDGNYRFTQRSEQMAFNHEVFSPFCRPDTRQDTLWIDDLHIKDIDLIGYTHFFPDDIVLLAFTHENTDRFYLKTERTEPNRFTSFFSGPGTMVPKIEITNLPAGLSNSDDLFVVEHTEHFDTVTYWLRDTVLVNQDTLNVHMTYEITDSIGDISLYTDTLDILSKVPYAKRLKLHEEEIKQWNKKIEKQRKKGEEVVDSVMPVKPLNVKFVIPQSMTPKSVINIEVPTPLERFDSTAINIYCMRDSNWYRAPFVLQRSSRPSATEREFEIVADWLPDTEYSFEVDTLAFEDIYGLTSAPYKTGFKVKNTDEFATLYVNVTYNEAPDDSIIVQLLDKSDNMVMEALAVKGKAEFQYVKPGAYFMRAIVDANGNGKWDTGNFYEDLQPEKVYYFPETFECKAKWDITKSWNLTQVPTARQKPSAITKQKADKEKKVQNRNYQRALDKGIAPPEKQ